MGVALSENGCQLRWTAGDMSYKEKEKSNAMPRLIHQKNCFRNLSGQIVLPKKAPNCQETQCRDWENSSVKILLRKQKNVIYDSELSGKK